MRNSPSKTPVSILEAASSALSGSISLKEINGQAVAEQVFSACQPCAESGSTPSWNTVEQSISAAIEPIALTHPDATKGIVQAQREGITKHICDCIEQLDTNNELLGKYNH